MVHSEPALRRPPLAPETIHPFCFVCGTSNPAGLALRFERRPEGGVRAAFRGHDALQGYPARLHGGVIATLLDGAMTHCLFDQGIAAVTAELQVRYLDAISPAENVVVQAWLESSAHGLHRVRAEITVDGVPKAKATAKFMNVHE